MLKVSWNSLPFTTRHNLVACVAPVTKSKLLEYISHGKRIDVEQAVAMTISYIRNATDSEDFEIIETDEFEAETVSAVKELVNDAGVSKMLATTCMWRTEADCTLLHDPREAATISTWVKIVNVLNSVGCSRHIPGPEDHDDLIELLKAIRRRRKKLDDSQYLTFPEDFLPQDPAVREQWSWHRNYKLGPQPHISSENTILLSKHRFRALQNLLSRLNGPTDKTSIYVLDVERFQKESGSISPSRLAALQASFDPYAIAYSFMTAQRRAQLKVVSDPRWTRFLIKGEGAMILQNRPDVLTSFEDILVRHATDIVALTAISCPHGVRDAFSSQAEILERTRKVCEFMERYVKDFGDGKMENLVFQRGERGGSGRGPVDVYNGLCDELRDCKARAKAMDLYLDIGPVYKFLAKDIMSWNDAWKDDAFANGKVPGWVEYLARVRLQDLEVV